MRLYRTELDKGISKKLFDIDADQFSSEDISFYENKITGELSVEHNSNGFYIRGVINIPFEQICDRCLTHFHDLKTTDFNFVLTDNAELLQDDTDNILFFSHNDNEIDLTSLFRELILLEQQMKNICRIDCKGLCINCGTNLNEGSCNCSLEVKDNPMETLRNLKDN